MDFDLDLNSENCTMNSFLELEKEIEEVPFFPDSVVRPSVIVKPSPKPAQSHRHHEQLRHRVRPARGLQRLLPQQHPLRHTVGAEQRTHRAAGGILHQNRRKTDRC